MTKADAPRTIVLMSGGIRSLVAHGLATHQAPAGSSVWGVSIAAPSEVPAAAPVMNAVSLEWESIHVAHVDPRKPGGLLAMLGLVVGGRTRVAPGSTIVTGHSESNTSHFTRFAGVSLSEVSAVMAVALNMDGQREPMGLEMPLAHMSNVAIMRALYDLGPRYVAAAGQTVVCDTATECGFCRGCREWGQASEVAGLELPQPHIQIPPRAQDNVKRPKIPTGRQPNPPGHRSAASHEPPGHQQ